MTFRILLAAFALACAAAPAIHVSPTEFRGISEQLSIESDAEFKVSEVRVLDQTVHVDLVGVTNSEGWSLTERASCVRCGGDGTPWRCSDLTSRLALKLPGGASADLIGIPRGGAGDLGRFLRELAVSSPSTLSMQELESVECVVEESEGVLTVVFGSTLHHASTSYGRLVLRRSEAGLFVESKTPPPSWFEGDTGPLGECFLSPEFSVAPRC